MLLGIYRIKMKLTAPKQRQGDYYETLAKHYLEAQGLTFFAKNWHYKNLGELDLVMLEPTQKKPCLVIVEVRQRKASQFGTSLDSITPAKQRKIIKTTAAFLQVHPQFDNFDIRFDVVSYEGAATAGQAGMPTPTWIKDAFGVN